MSLITSKFLCPSCYIAQNSNENCGHQASEIHIPQVKIVNWKVEIENVVHFTYIC